LKEKEPMYKPYSYFLGVLVAAGLLVALAGCSALRTFFLSAGASSNRALKGEVCTTFLLG
jgi:hypothetical protein